MSPPLVRSCGVIALSPLLGAMLLLSGCHHAPAPTVTTGRSSFQFVEGPPAKPRMAESSGVSDEPLVEDHFVDAQPIPPLTSPVFPKNVSTAKAGVVTIGVRINIDADGRVTSVGPSMLTFSTPTLYAKEFEAAVRNAVTTWRFEPAYRYSLRVLRTAEGGGAPQESHREKVETYFDLSFTFTSGGKVLTGRPQ